MPKDNIELQLSGYKAPAVHKAFQLLRAVADSRKGLGIVELAKQLGYSKSTTHGLVHALLREGALMQGPGARKLYLGPTVAELLFSTWDQEKFNKLAQPILDEIRDSLRETIFLGVRIHDRVLITAKSEAEEALRLSARVGSAIPLMAGAVGKVFLAGENVEQVAQRLGEKGLPRYTGASITIPADYLLELERVRSQGHGVDIEEYLPGIRAVAAAVRNRRGLPMAIWAVGVSGNINAMKIKHAAEVITSRAESLRRKLDETG